MYGVPSDLPLEKLVGIVCCQVCIGQYQVQFRFADDTRVCATGLWQVFDAAGEIVAQAQDIDDRAATRIQCILGSAVRSYVIDAPISFTLHFENGHSLTVFDDSEQYESFEIQPVGIIV